MFIALHRIFCAKNKSSNLQNTAARRMCVSVEIISEAYFMDRLFAANKCLRRVFLPCIGDRRSGDVTFISTLARAALRMATWRLPDCTHHHSECNVYQCISVSVKGVSVKNIYNIICNIVISYQFKAVEILIRAKVSATDNVMDRSSAQ